MKILIISALASIKRTLGASKVVMEAAESIRSAGVECDLFPSQSIDPQTFESELLSYLEATRGEYDVIEIPDTLPFAIDASHYCTLVVVRSVLLNLHRKSIKFQTRPTTLRSRIRSFLFSHQIRKQEAARLEAEFERTHNRLREAHIINVANSMDREVLEHEGYDPAMIHVFPYGLSDRRFQIFKTIQPDITEIVKSTNRDSRTFDCVFLGTFDFRKGCLDLVQIFQQICDVHSNARLKLLGARGLMTSANQMKRFFPRHLRSRVTVVESFEEDALPSLLQGCRVGLFPSYWEGFGIGVVEMLAAGLPVIAYRAPGPCDILPPEWLVTPGDIRSFSQKTLQQISSPQTQEARNAAARFRWPAIGKATAEAYRNALLSRG